MKKIFLMLLVFVFLFSVPPVVSAETTTEDLSVLKIILEKAKELQKKLIDREAPYLVYKIKVASPNGGETVKAGQFLDIKWDTSISGVSKINIYLVKEVDMSNKKEPGYVIARDVPVESNFYRWLVPNSFEGSGYKIFIRNNGKTYRLGDYSDSFFTIAPPEPGFSTVKLNSPKGGEMYIAGKLYSIHWDMPKGGDKYVFLGLIKGDDPDTSINYVNSGLNEYIPSSQGSVEWLVPDKLESGEYKLKIIGYSSISPIMRESTNVFVSRPFKVVHSSDLPNSLILLSPPPISEILSGQPLTISWISPYDMDRIDVFLRGLPSGRLYPLKYGIESLRPIDNNKFEWTAESKDPKEEKYIIMVCSSGSNKCAESQSPFSIVSEKTPESIVAKPIVEPDNPEYDKLRSIVSTVRSIIDEEFSDEEEVKRTATIQEDDINNYASPKQSGYLPYNFNTRLSVGMVDSDAVRALQEALIKEGLFDHPITGRFFGITEAAVKAFQKKYGLEASGSVGPGTQQKLNELYSVIEASATSASATSTSVAI